MRRVVVIQKSLSHYRVPFFEALRERLEPRGIQLEVVYGQPQDAEALKQDTAELAWGQSITNRAVRLGVATLLWQPCIDAVRGADLVIVEQASRLLLNYLLIAGEKVGGPRVAFWGHGRNLQGHTASRAGEAVKRLVSTRVHWWFAYNELSARIVRALGYPAERITDVQNAADTDALAQACVAVTEADVRRVREQHGIRGANVGLYIGGMYAEKRLDFLLDVCRLVRMQVPDFEMVFAGAGADAGTVRMAAATHPWIHYHGPAFGSEKAALFKASQLLLMPALVGLAITDAFATATPIVTTDMPYHGPEIAYLEDGVNGVMVHAHGDATRYAGAIARLLNDRAALETLQRGCRRAAGVYTIEAMSRRFAEGIEAALAAPRGIQSSVPRLFRRAA